MALNLLSVTGKVIAKALGTKENPVGGGGDSSEVEEKGMRFSAQHLSLLAYFRLTCD